MIFDTWILYCQHRRNTLTNEFQEKAMKTRSALIHESCLLTRLGDRGSITSSTWIMQYSHVAPVIRGVLWKRLQAEYLSSLSCYPNDDVQNMSLNFSRNPFWEYNVLNWLSCYARNCYVFIHFFYTIFLTGVRWLSGHIIAVDGEGKSVINKETQVVE